MRLGGGIVRPYSNPEEWMAIVKDLGYSAVTSPIDSRADAATVQAYKQMAKENDILIGEVGVWRNCLAVDPVERAGNMEYSKAQLALAEELGAGCCVNVAGNQGDYWCGCGADSFTRDTYDLIVDQVREIIDAVKPTHTFFTLEPMPWMVPDSPEQYLQLVKDVDRAAFGVHLDITNLIYTPRDFVNPMPLITRCFSLLGPYIKSIHAKDLSLEEAFSVRFTERIPGQGVLDYRRILPMVEKLGADTPVFTEHLGSEEEYRAAAAHLRQCAKEAGVAVK